MRFHGRAMMCLGAAAALVGACNNTTTAVVVPATDVVTSEAVVESNDAAWGFVVADPINTTTLFPTAPAVFDPNLAATQAAAGAGTDFTPTGCVQAVAAANVVTYTFNACQQGPVSLRMISGTVTATWSSQSAGPQVQIASTNLTIDGVPVTLAITATASLAGNLRTLTLTSNTTSGSVSSRTLNATVTWTQGTPCVTTNGSGTQTSGSTTFNVTVTNSLQCSGQCPTSGTVALTGQSATSTLTYNGTATTEVVDTNGQTSTVTLSCP